MCRCFWCISRGQTMCAVRELICFHFNRRARCAHISCICRAPCQAYQPRIPRDISSASAAYAALHARRISRICYAPFPSHKPHMPRALPATSATYATRHAQHICRMRNSQIGLRRTLIGLVLAARRAILRHAGMLIPEARTSAALLICPCSCRLASRSSRSPQSLCQLSIKSGK